MNVKENPVTIFFLMNRATRLLTRRAERRLNRMDLAVAQVPVLGALKDGSAKTQKELAEMVQIEQPAMAELLVRMERDGLISRMPDQRDRRSSVIALTALAKRKLPAAREALSIGHGEALEGFSEREIAVLTRLLERVLLNLERTTDHG
jgi:MarR family transcriptional regulator, transcriptional regulator for hemolysin